MRRRLNKSYLFLMCSFEQLAEEFADVAQISVEEAEKRLEKILTTESY